MPAVHLQKHVQAPPERVFALAADFARAPQYIRGIRRVELLTDGPLRVGTRFRETRVMYGKEASETMEVLALDPPRSYVLGCESHGCRFRSEVRCAPDGSGTQVEMSFAAQPLNFGAKLLGFLMAPMIKSCAKAMEQDLEDLKNVAEGRPAPAGAA